MGNYCRVFGCPRKLVKHCQYQHFIYLSRNVQNKLERYLKSGVAWLKKNISFPQIFSYFSLILAVYKPSNIYLGLTDLSS